MSATARGSEDGYTREAATPATPDVGAPAGSRAEAEREPDLADALKRRLVRLALDVHDGPMQNLAVIGFSLGALRTRLQSALGDGDPSQIDAGMEKLGAELGRVESDLRALIAALEDDGVSAVPPVEATELELAE
jgi:signal transduction histidine kinase